MNQSVYPVSVPFPGNKSNANVNIIQMKSALLETHFRKWFFTHKIKGEGIIVNFFLLGESKNRM